MKLLEYEAKRLLAASGIPVPRSVLIHTHADTVAVPAVLKSQVPTGGRGKAGGIVVVMESKDVSPAIDRLLRLEIKGFVPTALLAEELIDIADEYYVSAVVDRQSAEIQLIANQQGGVDVEENAKTSFFRTSLSHTNTDAAATALADYVAAPVGLDVLRGIVCSLLDCLTANDALLVEINPLILTLGGQLVAGDAKIELDDAAAFRHLDWHFENEATSSNFVTLDPRGVVATIANGAGLAMATVDAVADAGLRPANFLDIGGGANSQSVLTAFQKIMEYENIQAIVINIFAGITRCDEVAKAVIEARRRIDGLPPLFIRLSGTNVDKARRLLDAEHISLLPSLQACIDAVAQEVKYEK